MEVSGTLRKYIDELYRKVKQIVNTCWYFFTYFYFLAQRQPIRVSGESGDDECLMLVLQHKRSA